MYFFVLKFNNDVQVDSNEESILNSNVTTQTVSSLSNNIIIEEHRHLRRELFLYGYTSLCILSVINLYLLEIPYITNNIPSKYTFFFSTYILKFGVQLAWIVFFYCWLFSRYDDNTKEKYPYQWVLISTVDYFYSNYFYNVQLKSVAILTICAYVINAVRK